jgi:serine/threonine protein kinase
MTDSLVNEDISLDSLVGKVADEFLTRLERGERPDVEAYAARYPEAAPVLRKVLASLQVLDLSLAGLSNAAGETGESTVSGTLGDFRLIREVGRGGMGIVYEAEQISLGRRVALKVLPFAATLDPRQLQRFHNEARAAAGLHHTNIVPVHAVGCERGVHYYAMQFIEGRTLAELIAQQRRAALGLTPTTAEGEAAGASESTPPPAAQATSAAPRDAADFRRAAAWGIQAAEALDCAHQMGVVHRDVKPANLMVDTAGRLWVTDFGLAQVQSDAHLTLTGDLVGTLRYMSPEQALAKRVVIDHRTDVYSLGATLYELVTLRPAFTGTDRQELLRQIAFEEPLAPRRVNRKVPAELETIVLKAMEKNPADRYATAQELANDLRRYLEDKPIQAKRPTLAQRAAKWARRHQGAVLIAAALSGLVALALGASTVWVLRANQLKDDALDAKTQALGEKEAALAEKDKALREKEAALQEKGAALQQAVAEKKRADTLFQHSLDLTDAGGELAFALRLSADGRGSATAYRPIVAFWEDLLKDSPGDRNYLSQVSYHNKDLGLLLSSLGQLPEAVGAFRRSTEVAAQFVPEGQPLSKTKLTTVVYLSDSLLWLGETLRGTGQFEEADQTFARCLDIWVRMHQEQPNSVLNTYMMGVVHVRRGILLTARGQFSKAEAECRDALPLLAQTGRAAELGQARWALADALFAAGNREEAEKSYQAAVAAFKSPGGDGVTVIGGHQFQLTWLLATCPCAKVRQPDEAIELAKKSLHPGHLEADGWRTLGAAHYYAGAYGEAVAALRQSVDRRVDKDTLDRFLLAMAYCRLGKKEEAQRWDKQAVEGMDKYKPGDDKLRRFRAEAAELLGVKEQPRARDKEAPPRKE